jgi:hypothetical protein
VKGLWLSLSAVSIIPLQGTHFSILEVHSQNAEALVCSDSSPFIKHSVQLPQNQGGQCESEVDFIDLPLWNFAFSAASNSYRWAPVPRADPE